MPCSDSQDYDDVQETQKALDRRTDMLCRTLRNLDQLPNGIRGYLVPLDVSRWFDEHKKFDKSEGR